MRRTNGCLTLWVIMAACLISGPTKLFAQNQGMWADSIEVIKRGGKPRPSDGALIMPIEGYVIGVKDSAHLTLDVGKTGGIKKGMKLKIFREGPPMKHSVTGQMVPGIKQWLAEVEVTLVDKTNSEAKVTKWTIKPAKPIQVGDKFRTAEK
jgi:hypothetical protein